MIGAGTREDDEPVVSSRLMRRVFIGFSILAALSVAISVAGRMFGASIAMAGFTDDTSLREVVIGNNVLTATANTIRFERARRDGVAPRLDLYLRWPQLDGFSLDSRDDFNGKDGRRTIVFLGFEERHMSRDMSGRFAPIYSGLIRQPGRSGPAGVVFYDFKETSGYLNERLAVAQRPGFDPFVARCLEEKAAAESTAPCERDVHLGDNLTLTYRFPAELLGDWQTLDSAITRHAAAMLRSGS
jgi:hypothetical protein